MKAPIRLFAEFHNRDSKGRVRFTNGTERDIERLNIKLKPGLKVILDNSEGMTIEGVVEFSDEENIWVMKYDHSLLTDTSGR